MTFTSTVVLRWTEGFKNMKLLWLQNDFPSLAKARRWWPQLPEDAWQALVPFCWPGAKRFGILFQCQRIHKETGTVWKFVWTEPRCLPQEMFQKYVFLTTSSCVARSFVKLTFTILMCKNIGDERSTFYRSYFFLTNMILMQPIMIWIGQMENVTGFWCRNVAIRDLLYFSQIAGGPGEAAWACHWLGKITIFGIINQAW